MTPTGEGAPVSSHPHPASTILLINPNTSRRSTEMMVAVARSASTGGFSIRGVTATRGPSMILDEAALATAAEEVVRIGLQEGGAVEAVIVAAFGDPGARRLAEHLAVPVLGIGGAAIREAAAGGRRFGIATTTPGLVRSIAAMVADLGCEGAFTGIRLPGASPLALAADPELQEDALARAARQCVELDGAEAVIIGGGPLSEAAARLRDRLATEIVQPVPAALRMIEAQLRLRAERLPAGPTQLQ